MEFSCEDWIEAWYEGVGNKITLEAKALYRAIFQYCQLNPPSAWENLFKIQTEANKLRDLYKKEGASVLRWWDLGKCQEDVERWVFWGILQKTDEAPAKRICALLTKIYGKMFTEEKAAMRETLGELIWCRYKGQRKKNDVWGKPAKLLDSCWEMRRLQLAKHNLSAVAKTNRNLDLKNAIILLDKVISESKR